MTLVFDVPRGVAFVSGGLSGVQRRSSASVAYWLVARPPGSSKRHFKGGVSSLSLQTEVSRRAVLRTLVLLPVAVAMSSQVNAATATGGTATGSGTSLGSEVPVPPLPYPYNALEPVIDAKTMRLHHDKHFVGYVTKVNAALTEEQRKTFPSILTRLSTIPDRTVRETVRNQGGGAINHRVFFEIMRTPVADAQRNTPGGALGDAINRQFGSLAAFQKEFTQAAKTLFGSGWVWLYEVGKSPRRELKIGTFANQDSPLMQGNMPLLGLDVWEHAYYLRYGPDRGAYVDAWWRVVNWPAVEKIFETRQLP